MYKFESPLSKDELCQVLLKLAQWFWRRFLKFVNVFWLFRNYLPLEKGRALHLNKLEFPSPKDDLCQVWLKLTQWFWRRRFLKFVNVFLHFRNYLPLEKGGALLIPFTHGCFVPSLVEIGQVVLEKKMTTTTTTMTTDNGQILIRKAHLSLRLR